MVEVKRTLDAIGASHGKGSVEEEVDGERPDCGFGVSAADAAAAE